MPVGITSKLTFNTTREAPLLKSVLQGADEERREFKPLERVIFNYFRLGGGGNVAFEDTSIPERVLWAYALVQAFLTKVEGVYENEVWFFSDSKAVGSYLYICEVLNLNPRITFELGMKARALQDLTGLRSSSRSYMSIKKKVREINSTLNVTDTVTVTDTTS